MVCGLNMIKKNKTFVEKIKLLLIYSENRFTLGPKDVLLCSYPKSGNTWLRVLYYHYLAKAGRLDVDFSFSDLDGKLPELGRSYLSRHWPFELFPRVIKTHRPHARWFDRCASKALVVRDPGDVMVSYYKYASGLNTFVVDGDLSEFVRDDRLGVSAWMRYHEGWIDNADFLVTYSELRNDTAEVLAKFLAHMGCETKEELVQQAVDASAFERVKKAEKAFGHTRPEEAKEGFRFARDGSLGQGKRALSADDMAFIERAWGQHRKLDSLRKRLGDK